MGSENSFPMDHQMCPMLSRPCTILFTPGRGNALNIHNKVPEEEEEGS